MHKTFQTNALVQNVQIATEKRMILGYDNTPIQDFAERYFAGAFQFEVDVTKCSPLELGLIIEGVMYMHKLGRGYNTGYADVKILKIDLVKSLIIRRPKALRGGHFQIIEETTEETLPREFTEALSQWKEYATQRVAANEGG